MSDYRPDLYGHVEASYRTAPPPEDIAQRALEVACPDCNVNVFIEEHPKHDGLYETKIAHDETCPWLRQREGEGRG